MFNFQTQFNLAAVMLPVLLGVAACAGAPVQEMSNARQTITAARAAGAEDVAPEALAAASDLLVRAEQALLEREYRTARSRAEEARRFAQTALQMASTALPN